MKYFSLLILLAFLLGCDPMEESVNFLSSQPENIKISNSFNKKYQGSYRKKGDSTKLIILNNKIIKILTVPISISRREGDSLYPSAKDENDLRYLLSKDNIEVTHIIADSIYGVWEIRDTLFLISDKNVLKLYKGSYFLNFKKNNESWKVQRVDLNKNRLTFGMILPTDSLFKEHQIEKMYEIKDESGDVINYQIKPSKKELKKMVKENTFQEWEVWIKEK